ncbi:hypothetical protein AB0N09_07325 [Streptomyces erythrochromogenes]|uniref:hypothetical protein n=1 Tax=Streptomyces erythrochromogenes TaxID=285574 RepID=UPI00342DC91C
MMRRQRTTALRLRTVTALALTGLAATAASVVPAHADVAVACSTADLITAINAANAGGDSVLNLDPYCVYEVTTAASADDGLPPITLAAGITINGNNATVKRTGSTNYRLFDVSGGGAKLTLNDLTVMNGNPSSAIGGGGVLVQNGGTLIGDNLSVQGSTGNIGGGIRGRTGSTVTLTNSSLKDNRTAGGASIGGGLAAEGTTSLTGTDFTGNRARVGAALYHPVGNLTVTGGSARFNTSADEGGGLYIEGGTTTVDGMAIADNRSATGGQNQAGGGGLYVVGGTTTIRNSTISGNKVTGSGTDLDGGGGVLLSRGTLNLENSQVTGNQVIGEGALGGGVGVLGGTLNVTDGSSVSRNLVSGRYSTGGGIHSRALVGTPTITVTDSSVDMNTATGTGSFAAGVYNSQGAYTLTNATVSNNAAPQSTGAGGIWTDVPITAVATSTFTGNAPTNCLRSPQPVTGCLG